jgi:hypothetical protein
MSALLDQAMGVVLALPDDQQDEIARVMMALAADNEAVEPIDPAHLQAVLEGLDQAKRGQFATPAAVDAAFARFGR